MRGCREAPRRGTGPETARRDWLVGGVAAAGLLVAGFLAAAKFAAGTAPFCAAGSGCEAVQASRYAVFLGMPTALWGAGLYAVIGALALLGLDARRWLAAFLLAVAGVSFSGYLIALQIFVIGAVCAYCLLSAGIAAALFVLLLVRRPAETERRSVLRPGRLLALGAVTAVATVALGAGGFELGRAGPASAYIEALARHLAQSGAVMYGAYW
ncbi:MAG: vitamin K epoxide reductase family protein [candidate division NC10 bacterium]|nr:vitamin K epoxide reductase family protein [candidate division NC10 bacterium]